LALSGPTGVVLTSLTSRAHSGGRQNWRLGAALLEKVERAINLGGVCWKVLMLDKEMLLFPIMSTMALLSLIGGGGLVLYVSPELLTYLHTMLDQAHPDQDPRFWVLVFVFMFVNYFIVIFFNAGLMSCALIRFAGGDPTVMDGLSVSLRRLPQIFVWALVTTTIGWILKIIESRLKGLGRLLVGLLGAGWAVATYFAVPILVVDRVGPIDAVKRSVQAVRKTWGEALVGHIGLGSLNLLTLLVGGPLIFLGVFVYGQNPLFGAAIVTVAIGIVLLGTLIISTLSSILRAALYIYAIEGEVPMQFDRKLISGAFQPGKR
jgi:uncharacterized membrane protein